MCSCAPLDLALACSRQAKAARRCFCAVLGLGGLGSSGLRVNSLERMKLGRSGSSPWNLLSTPVEEAACVGHCARGDDGQVVLSLMETGKQLHTDMSCGSGHRPLRHNVNCNGFRNCAMSHCRALVCAAQTKTSTVTTLAERM